MKYYIITMVATIAILTVSSCSPGGGTTTPPPVTPPAPVSTFNITFNGHTYNLTSSTTVPVTSVTASTSTPGQAFGIPDYCTGHFVYADFKAAIIASNSQINAIIGGNKMGASSAIGTYRSGSYNDASGDCTKDRIYGGLQVIDMGDGGKVYTSDQSGKDTTGTITVTVSNATECKGTFSVILSYSGNYYPATGDFDYKH